MEDNTTGQSMEILMDAPKILDVSKIKVGIIEPLDEDSAKNMPVPHMLLVLDGDYVALKPEATQLIHNFIVDNIQTLKLK